MVIMIIEKKKNTCTSMYELSGARGSSGGEILSFNEADTESPCGGIKGGARTGGSAADDENVERFIRCGADQRRPLELSRREDGEGVVDLLVDGSELGSVIASGELGGEKE